MQFLYIILLLILFLPGCGRSALAPTAPTFSADAQVALDWQVYQAVISDRGLQPNGAVLLLREPSSGKDGLPVGLASHSKALLRDLQVNFAAAMQPSTLINFRDRNQSETVSAGDFPAQANLVFLDSADLELLTGEDQTRQAALQERYPGARGLTAFSFVGYDDTLDQALVYVRYPISNNMDEGDYLLLQSRGGDGRPFWRDAVTRGREDAEMRGSGRGGEWQVVQRLQIWVGNP